MSYETYRQALDPLLASPGLNLLYLAAESAYPTGSLDPDTLEDMAREVERGALARLGPWLIWPALCQGLLGTAPSRMLESLRQCGALNRLLPELDALFGCFQAAADGDMVDIGQHQLRVLDQLALAQAPLASRVAALFYNLGKSDSPAQHLPSHYRHLERCLPRLETVCNRYGIDRETRDLAVLVAMELERVHRAAPMRAASIAALLERVDAFGQPQRFARLMHICAADFCAYQGNEGKTYPKADLMQRALEACRALDAQPASEDADETSSHDRQEARALAVARALRSERWSEEGMA